MKLAKKIEKLRKDSKERMLDSSVAYQYGIMFGSLALDLIVLLGLIAILITTYRFIF